MVDYVYVCPKMNGFVDRLGSTIELYRPRQNAVQQQQYDEFGENAVYQQPRQHPFLLRQSNKATKRKRKSKSDNTTSDKRNQLVTNRQKHKLDTNSIENQHHLHNQAERMYRFEDDEPHPAKISKTTSTCNVDGISSSASIRIDHQIDNVQKAHQDKEISTNVDAAVHLIAKSQLGSEDDIKTNVERKQEPKEDSTIKSKHIDIKNKNNEDIDPELADIFKSIENEEDMSNDLVNELNRFEEICRSIKDSVNKNLLNSAESGDIFSSYICVDHRPGPGQVQAPSYHGVPAHSAGLSLSEGGLAAEQMVAQHQLGHGQFGDDSPVDRVSDLPETESYGQRSDYSSEYYSGIPRRPASTGLYPGQQQSTCSQSQQQSVPVYNQTTSKQLAPYAPNATPTPSDNGPSSLQLLQHRVAHFKPDLKMEITQTQRMQVSDGSNQMQLSQMQPGQLRQPFRNISLMQQQCFATDSAMGQNSTHSQNFTGNDQITLQPQPMLSAKMHSDPCQQAHLQQEYIGRRPPEYTMQHANNISGGNLPNGIGPNQLHTNQTIQNQTNAHPDQVKAYSSVKTGSNGVHNGKLTARMSAMQQRQQMNISMSQCQHGYSRQLMHRQAWCPSSLSHQMPSGMQTQRYCPSTYNSTVVQNQRPPHVNIVADGLNISKSRMYRDWSRDVNPMTGPIAVAPTTADCMMLYRTYSSDGLSPNTAQMQVQMRHEQKYPRTMHIDTMQSQQAAMMRNNAHAQRMMWQQQMTPQQMFQGSSSSVNTPFGMTPRQCSAYISQTNTTTQDDILNLLDTTPNQLTDVLDIRRCGVWSDVNVVEDITGR